MVLVAVRDQDEVAAHVRGLEGGVGIAGEERVDDQAGLGGLDEEAGVAEIGDAHGRGTEGWRR